MDHRTSSGRHTALAIAARLVALSALGGAVGLVGGWIDLGRRLNSRLPFGSPVVSGIALALIVCLPFGVVARRAWNGDRRTGPTAVLAGVALIGWIVIELVFIRQFSFLQPVLAAVGAAFVVIGFRSRSTAENPVDRDAVGRFLAQPRIAVIGASADPHKFGNTVFRALRDHGFDVLPVNPRATEIEGTTCVAGIADAEGDLTAAIIMVTGSAAVEAVHACAARGVPHVWLFQGVGNPGAVSPESIAACRQHELDAVVGACPLMFLDPVSSVHKAHLAVRRFNGAFSSAN